MNIDRHRERRARVLQAMADRGGGVAVHFTAPERLRNRDAEYPYRFDSSFWYLTGFAEPDSALVLVAHRGQRQAILFCREKHEERELWDGFRYGPELAQAAFGFDAAHPIERMDEVVPDLLADSPALFYALGASPALDARVQGWLQKVRAQARTGRRAPASVHDFATVVDEMRLVKDASEVETMRRAARISAAAHARAMRACRVGMREFEIEAELLHEFRRQGAQSPGVSVDRGGRPQRVRAALPGGARRGEGRRPRADRRGLRGGRLRGRHHADDSGERPLHRRAARRLRRRAGRAAGCHGRGAARQGLQRAARRGDARADAGPDRPRPARRIARRRAGVEVVPPVLHAQDRALARAGRARRGRLPRAGRCEGGEERRGASSCRA